MHSLIQISDTLMLHLQSQKLERYFEAHGLLTRLVERTEKLKKMVMFVKIAG